MKFTNGYWLVKKGIQPLYATEYGSHILDGKKLTVYVPTKKIASRADALNYAALTVELTSPMENVIHIAASHFQGAPEKGPILPVKNDDPQVCILDEEDFLTFASGDTRAVICKKPGQWEIRYYYKDRLLTGTGWRNLACMQDETHAQNYMVEQLSLGVGENVYGLGERFTPFVKNGQTVEMWNGDGGTASELSYKNVPFYLTNRNYGVLVDDMGDVAFEIGSEKVENVQFSVKGEKLAYYILGGESPKGVVQQYAKLTGMPALPPAWSFGLWLTTSFTTDYDEATTLHFIQGMEERHIPLRVFHFDCYWMRGSHWCDFVWDPDTFPDPEGIIRRYHERGLKICVWLNSYVAQQSHLFQEGKGKGYFLKKTDGTVWQSDLWQPGMAIVDFTNPAAKKWYQDQLRRLARMGVDSFKSDFGERIPVKDICYFDGSDPVKMHNYYTVLYNQAVFEVLEEEKGKGNACLFARSTFAGGQKYPVHWGGDSSASYPSMAETLRGGLSLSCAAYGFWSHDIGGFENTATPDLYKRWCQFGLLSSHSRLHGSTSYRVPWAFDEEACDVLRQMVELKCSLMPYLYRMAAISHETGTPMLRPMFLEFPDDPACLPLDRQYMLGDNLLVAPIFSETGEVEYYLPAGRWINLITGEGTEGGWHKEKHGYTSLPLMVRPNTILAMGANNQRPDYAYADDVTLYLSEFDDGAQATAEIPNLDGHTAMTARAVRDGNHITVKVEGGHIWQVKLLGKRAAKITQQKDTAVVELL
jgi:alpha-D-xyloside xylohydrolase